MASERATTSPSPVLTGLAALVVALVAWTFLTPLGWQSLSLYVPPLVVGLVLGTRQGWWMPWGRRLAVAVVYGLALFLLAVAVVVFTDGPPRALYTAAAMIVVLMIPLAVVGLALGESLAKLAWRHLG